MFNALSLDARKHTDEYSIRFGSVRFGTKVTYDEHYPLIAKGLDLTDAAKLAALKVSFENDLAPYTDVLELLASLEKNTPKNMNKLNINLTSKHPELENAKQSYTTDWANPENTLARVTQLYELVLEKVKAIHEILESAGLAKPVEKASEAE